MVVLEARRVVGVVRAAGGRRPAGRGARVRRTVARGEALAVASLVASLGSLLLHYREPQKSSHKLLPR